MILTVFLNKLKLLAILFINIFRKAICCIKRRRNSNCDVIPLTHVITNTDQQADWTEWDDENNEPKSVQDHIDLYRKKKIQNVKQSFDSSNHENQSNFFEDMTPLISKQAKIYLGASQSTKSGTTNKFNIVEDRVHIPSAELKAWEDNSGWEADSLNDTQQLLRENKRLEREQRALEHQQKRHEKMLNRSLGAKLTTL